MVTDAPEGPGWYIYATRDGETTLIQPVKVAPAAAQVVAQSFDEVLRGVQIPVTPTQLVESGSNLVRHAIQEQLREAEEAASRIKGLRQALASLGPDTVETPETGDTDV